MDYREELFKALTAGVDGVFRDKSIDALVEVCKAARKEGYNAGIKDGNISDGTFAEKIKEAYENGANDVWECVNKIYSKIDKIRTRNNVNRRKIRKEEANMRGYKAFNKDLTCRDMQYEVGKEYKFDGEPIPCRQGFHFCETIADCYKFYPMSDDTRICEVEATGEIAEDGVKRVTNVIKILAEITCDNLRKGNTGTSNSGYRNSGNRNSGNRNSGNRNSGNRNSGNRNSGDWNSGYRNSGNRNSGYSNSGNRNSGDWNSGDCNSGDWNSGYRNSGVFNTEKKPTIKMFDKESPWTYNDWCDSRARRIMAGCPYSYSDYIPADDMTDEEKENHPEHKTIGGFVKVFTATAEDKQKWWDSLSKEDKDEVKALPNFDADKFCKCVGIEHI